LSSKWIVVPLFLLLIKNIAAVPQGVALGKSCLEYLDLVDLRVSELDDFFILLIVFHFVVADVVSFADSVQFGQGCMAHHVGLR